MWNYVIFIICCLIISYIIYKTVKSQWYNILLERKMNGDDISHITNPTEFDEEIGEMINTIISKYEEAKTNIKSKEKNDNMFQ